MSESTFTVSGCKGTKKTQLHCNIIGKFFSDLSVFRNLGDNQYENAIC